MNKNLEHALIQSIDPIRGYVLATTLYQFFDYGIYDLIKNKSRLVSEIAKELDYDKTKLSAMLQFLVNENIVEIEDEKVFLTDKGKETAQFRAWYTMLIGGYGQTFLQLGDTLKNDAGMASRNAAKVGIGSCGISYYDALPLTKRLMKEMSYEPKCILDLGCGNGLYLTEFCRYFPDIYAIGVEPDANGCKAARHLIKKTGFNDRVKIINNTAQGFLKKHDNYNPDLLILGFILHEILGQEGEEGVCSFLRSVREKYPHLFLIIIEVDDQFDNQTMMQHGLSKAYYNAYYLLHYFTQQKLKKPDFWERVFNIAGYRIVSQQTTDGTIDSTGLELGYLLKAE